MSRSRESRPRGSRKQQTKITYAARARTLNRLKKLSWGTGIRHSKNIFQIAENVLINNFSPEIFCSTTLRISIIITLIRFEWHFNNLAHLQWTLVRGQITKCVSASRILELESRKRQKGAQTIKVRRLLTVTASPSNATYSDFNLEMGTINATWPWTTMIFGTKPSNHYSLMRSTRTMSRTWARGRLFRVPIPPSNGRARQQKPG